ncbi:hypothetical protein [Pyruvatibacter sp.]
MKTYKSEAGVRAALKRQGMQNMAYEIEEVTGGFTARVYVLDMDDWRTVRDRGFTPEINKEKAVS